MNQAVISDEALRQAAASVRRAMLDSLPPPSQCEHTFSDLFQARMKRLLSRYDRRRTLRTLSRRVAAVLLAALIGGGVWLSVDAGARAAFLTWAREVYEEQILYRFFGAPAADALPLYQITWLPEGYTADTYLYRFSGEAPTGSNLAYRVSRSGENHTIVDIFDQQAAYSALHRLHGKTDGIVLDCFLTRSEAALWFTHTGEYTCQTLSVRGASADLYVPLTSGEASHLIWPDPETGVVLSLSAPLEADVLRRMANSIQITEGGIAP